MNTTWKWAQAAALNLMPLIAPQILTGRRLRRAAEHRLPEQGRDLRSVVQGLGRDDEDIAADPKHLGARIAITSVLHTWGSAMTHHPHVHMIVPGGGLSPDGNYWIAPRPNFLLPVLVLSKLFRRLMLERLATAHPCCGARMHIIERSEAGGHSRHRTTPTVVRIDTS